MIEQEYADIAAACDRLLRAPGTSLERVAIPLLHVINEHPSCIRQYQSLLSSRAGSRPDGDAQENALPLFTDSVRAAVRVGRALKRSFWRRPGAPQRAHDRLHTWARGASGPADVLIVSHLGNPAQLECEDDFYFGGMQRLLQSRGLRSTVVLIDHRLRKAAGRSRSMDPSPFERQLLPQAASPALEARIWRRCFRTRRELREAALHSGSAVDGALAMLASRHAVSWETAANLRLHESICELCAQLKPRIVMTLYEGDACERMIWHAARSQGRRPLCVGYQHARLHKLSHAVRRSVTVPEIDCDPDVVLTLGETSHAMLTASPGLRAVRLIPYGSHRRAEPRRLPPIGERPDICLALADADERECATLFGFALDCACSNPATTFVFRPHPLVNIATLRSRYHSLRELPDNVGWSQGNTLEQECAQARYCLYRGSSAVLQAVLAGVKPFYLARPGELAFDPLFALTEWREIVTASENFSASMKAADTSAQKEAADRARTLYDHYVSPVRPAALDEMLALVAP